LSGTDAVKYHSLSIRTVFSNYLRHEISLFTISTRTVQTFTQIVSIGIVTKALSKHDQDDALSGNGNCSQSLVSFLYGTYHVHLPVGESGSPACVLLFKCN
jgi:hypothetical protein